MAFNQAGSSKVMSLLQRLQRQGAWRAIDVQFALFIYQKALSSIKNLPAKQNLPAQEDSQTDQSLISPMQISQAESLGVLACALSYELGQGHVCLDLSHRSPLQVLELEKWLLLAQQTSFANVANSVSDLPQEDWVLDDDQSAYQSLLSVDWQGLLQTHSPWLNSVLAVVGQKTDDLSLDWWTDGSVIPSKPLVYDAPFSCLYLTRYWYYETHVAKQLKQRSHWSPSSKALRSVQTQLLNELFVEQNSEQDEINWQKVAAAMAVSRHFCVISGGPGTGKTTTVVKLLAVLLGQALHQSAGKDSDDLKATHSSTLPSIKLVAPTGKAAARLTESIGATIDSQPIAAEIKAAIPRHASTIHQLLGARHDTTKYRYHKHNPLHLDILVVDEASMVDLPMMSQLLDALPDKAKLILLGDKDQLSSVGAGSVLADICLASEQSYSEFFLTDLNALTGYSLPSTKMLNAISDSVCVLQKSYRFGEDSGIGRLARAINQGDIHQVTNMLEEIRMLEESRVQEETLADIAWYDVKSIHWYKELMRLICQGYADYLTLANRAWHEDKEAKNSNQASNVSEMNDADLLGKTLTDQQMMDKARTILSAFAKQRLLCAVREGDYGVEAMNDTIEQTLKAQGQILNPSDETWYIGKPILMTRNDSTLGLHNGDIGICLLDESVSTPQLRVYFELPDGSIKGFLPSRLHHYELAFAMTIHKSQGSEFAHTLILLPAEHSPIVSRELVYTGITRAKQKLDIFATEAVLERATQTPTQRVSGLRERLTYY